MRMTPRQAAFFEVVAAHAPVKRDEVARVMQCKISNAQKHLHMLRVGGMIRTQGNGRTSCWVLAPMKTAAMAVRRHPIEQASSVWHYAARCGGVNHAG